MATNPLVHVHLSRIRSNNKKPVSEHEAPIIVKRKGEYSKSEYANGVIIRDSSGIPVASFIYSPEKPLKCGARIWFELLDAENYSIEVK